MRVRLIGRVVGESPCDTPRPGGVVEVVAGISERLDFAERKPVIGWRRVGPEGGYRDEEEGGGVGEYRR